ncbi:hypothetical protein E0765_06135 [Sulfuricurvum sp. IAE1]|uniref:hypothetical protein n=1 Tax=Sulfuricurvum sp. IAE1 TaxID=2546102 RepID=UPI00105198D9|nr:hypothetical protein [Sulfuricurvum sp. IAE1]TDA64291.1 hypothetical protein E0765_06135 [Sulfuricurvum sp. IAE1]
MINIDANFKEMNRFIGSLPKQLNYGASVGLNNLATHMRDSELAGAKNTLTLRGRWYEPRSRFGFNVQFAKKNDLNAAVYTRADWLVLHTEGGTKTGRGRIAIPTAEVKRSKRDMITRSNRPRNIKGSFLVHTSKGDAIAVRKGRGKRSRLVILYWLEKQAKIKKVYDFYEIGKKVYDRNAQRYLGEGVDKAWASIKN